MDETSPPEADQPYVPIAPQDLSAEALRGVAEAFVLREGTDYGAVELGFDDKVARLLELIARGDARITYDTRSQSVHIVEVKR